MAKGFAGASVGSEQSLSFLNWKVQEIHVPWITGLLQGCILARSPQKEGTVILPEEG